MLSEFLFYFARNCPTAGVRRGALSPEPLNYRGVSPVACTRGWAARCLECTPDINTPHGMDASRILAEAILAILFQGRIGTDRCRDCPIPNSQRTLLHHPISQIRFRFGLETLRDSLRWSGETRRAESSPCMSPDMPIDGVLFGF